MNIVEIWNQYKKSGRTIPEFDSALAEFASVIGVDKDRAVEAVAQMISSDPTLARTSSSSFPLVKMADDGLGAIEEILEFLKVLESEADPDAVSGARSQISGILTGNDAEKKKALLKAIEIHRTDFPRARFAQQLDSSTRISLSNFVSKGLDGISEFKYVKGMWKTDGHLPNIVDKLLDQAAKGDNDAIEDFIEMSKTSKGKEYLAAVDKRTLGDKISRISSHAPGRINTKSIMDAHEAMKLSLADRAARQADPNKVWSQLRRMFGRHTPMMDRLRATGKAITLLPGLLKAFALVAAALGAVGGIGYGAYKAYDYFKGPSSGSPGTAPPAESADGSGDGKGGAAGVGGSMVDKVHAELQKIYSK